MGRQLRSKCVADFCHVISRGNNRGAIVRDDWDREQFLRLGAAAALKHRWIVVAYCLMSNHYHLVVRLPHGGLSEGIQELNSGFARLMNRKHGRLGHLFQQRFHSEPITDDSHLREVARYVPLNPVRAGICADPSGYPWSSYRATVGLDHPRLGLSSACLLELFGRTPELARSAYAAFVSEGHVTVSDTEIGRLRP